MPLTINVGLSQKSSHNYQSTGVSINVTAELDQALLARPEALQGQIDALYAHARRALEGHAGAAPQPVNPPAQGSAPAGVAGPRAEHSGNGNGRGTPPSPMTASQRRAILAIARQLNVDPDAEARDVIGAGLDELSLRQASQMIDHLKGLQPADAGGNGR